LITFFSKSFKVISLFSYQGSLCFVADLQLLQNIMSVSFCQQLFLFF